MSKKSNSTDFVVGAVIGGLIGAATALFLAPKAGKELRADLNESASFKSLAEKGSELAEVAKEKTISLSQVVAEQSNVIIDMIKEVTNQTKDSGVEDKNQPIELLEEVSNTASKSQEDFIPLKPANEEKDEF